MKSRLVSLVLAMASVPTAMAETPKTAAPAPRPSNQYRKPAPPFQPYHRDASEFKYQVLKSAPDLPNMPPWPSAYKLVDSVVNPNAKGGTVYQVTFDSPDTIEQVLQYYQSTLPVYRWGITSQSKMSVMAMRKPDIVQVNVMPPTAPKAKSRILILFNQNSKAKGDQQ